MDATENESLQITDPNSQSLLFRVGRFNNDSAFSRLDSFNYFTVILVLKGEGELTADTSNYTFSSGCLLSFSLYQPFKINCPFDFEGLIINFHPDFFCLHKHRAEVSCNGVLFNNIYESPLTSLTETETAGLSGISEGLLTEMQREGDTDTEVLLAYLKILLIAASRIKVNNRLTGGAVHTIMPEILISLQAAIESNYKSIHSASAYTELLNLPQAALNKACRAYFNKTLSGLITDRVVLEAKRELYLSSKPVKAIAYDLGFTDEFHFSRYFKKNVNISPQAFRQTVGVGRSAVA